MAHPTAPTRRKPARRAAVAASLLFHALVLAALGWRAAPRLLPRDAAAERRDVELTLVWPTPSPATSRPSTRRASDSPPTLTALPRPATPSPPPRPTPARARPAAAPSAAAPATAPLGPGILGSGTSGGGTGVHPGPLPGAEVGGDLKGFLRAGVGCTHRDGVGLTPAERERCDQKAAKAARTGPGGLLIPDDKIGGYLQEAEANARKRALREAPLSQPFIPCPSAQAGSNLGLGCLPKEASHTVVRF